jgi:two-component system sensor histidine kinase YesM
VPAKTAGKKTNVRDRNAVDWKKSINTRLILAFTAISLVFLAINLMMFSQINSMISRIDSLYSSNVSLNEISGTLENVRSNMLGYLNTRGSDSLNQFYKYDQDFTNLVSGLNQTTTDSEKDLLEKNIYNMSHTYIKEAEETIQAKRGRFIEQYKETYAESEETYGYISTMIMKLNNLLFANNAKSYRILQNTLNTIELLSVAVIIIVILVSITLMALFLRNMTKPLAALARTADKVSGGNFDVPLEQPKVQDEVGVVQGAFNGMVSSVRNYIVQQKESMEKEQEMKERELLMETHLKDAQLKYLQAQINPHFLFNSLNAGAQLAMMEDAEKTNTFMQRMADFFRYNVRKMSEDTTLAEEIEAVDNYLYILNVRFAGDLHFSKFVEEGIGRENSPSMILQPIVENAVTHGVRDIEWEKKISLTARHTERGVLVTVTDNGIGMTPGQIERVMSGGGTDSQSDSGSTGVGLDNVIKRLELYYNEAGLLTISSPGINQGTTVELILPLKSDDEPEGSPLKEPEDSPLTEPDDSPLAEMDDSPLTEAGPDENLPNKTEAEEDILQEEEQETKGESGNVSDTAG